jgi:hypothetical protein
LRIPALRSNARGRFLSTCALILIPAPALAQQADPAPPAPAAPAAPGVAAAKTFLPEDFSRFAPRTALDMVAQIPGFSIQGVEERRGFGQGSGNIVTNGKRISGKSNDAIEELRRIPSDRVVRIELVDAATLDIPGLSGQVANVITRGGTTKTTFDWRPNYRPKIDRLQAFNGSASVSGSRGPVAFTLGLENTAYAGGGIGPERVVDRFGNLIDYRDENGHFFGNQPQLSGSVKYQGASGHVGNVNGSYRLVDGTNKEISLRSGTGQPDRVRDFLATEEGSLYEVGGDYEVGLGRGRLKFIGLHRSADLGSSTVVLVDFADGRKSGVRNLVEADEVESILRSEYRWKAGGADWQVSLEGALNSLDNSTEYSTLSGNSGFVVVPLPNANAKIQEKRAEAILSYGRQIAKNLSIQAAAGAEYSNLSQSGPSGLDRTFYRPKGSLAAAWKASPTLNVNARIERAVGQLNFYSFLESVNVLSETKNAGNPNLVPQQSWNAELEAAKNFPAYGSLKAKAYVRLIEDIVDQIPVGETGESPGNIDKAHIYGVQLNSTLRFDPFGWKGAKLDLDLRLQDSSVKDPVLGFFREISVTLKRQIDARFRYDVPDSKWAGGVNYFDRRNYDNYRLGEISNLYTPENLEAFVEHKDVMGLKVRGSIANLLGTNETYRRAVHVGRRGTPLSFVESRRRSYGLVFGLGISGTL